MIEKFFTCPYCWQETSMVLDSYDEQPEYIEDCEVCCRPIEVCYRIVENELVSFSVQRVEGIS